MNGTMLGSLALCAFVALGTTHAADAAQRVQAKACVQSARTERLACRAACRDGGEDVGDCLRSCRRAYRGARRVCKTICSDGCTRAATTAPCQGQCGMELGQCARAAATAGADCIRDCTARGNRSACVQGCVDEARGSAAGCFVDFADCVEACRGGGSTTTTTLIATTTSTLQTTTTTMVPATTTTTFPTPPSCESSEAPICGGACPEVGQSCAEVSPGVCGCVGGSPSAAFVDAGATR